MIIPAITFVPDGVTDFGVFLLLGSIAAILVSMAKAGFGGSVGLLSIPILIYACQGNARSALGVMLPILIACDQVSIAGWWRKWDIRVVGMLLPGAVGGIALGTVALWWFEQIGDDGHQSADAAIKLGIALIALMFVALQIVRSVRRKTPAMRPTFRLATSVGAAAGFTSTLAHAAGPIVTMYMLPQQMPKGRYVASTVLYYWTGNLLKVPPYIWLGLLDTRAFVAGLSLVPAVIVGTLLGLFLHRRVGQRSFTGIVYVLLTLAGVDLLRQAITIMRR